MYGKKKSPSRPGFFRLLVLPIVNFNAIGIKT